MNRLRSLPTLLLLVAYALTVTHSVRAQSAAPGIPSPLPATTSSDQIMRLPWNTWQYHVGDDPQCALPIDTNKTNTCEWHNGTAPPVYEAIWYRIEVNLPLEFTSRQELSLLVRGIDPVSQVYADGELVGGSGSFSTGRGPVYSSVVMTIPPRLWSSGRLILAVRTLSFGYGTTSSPVLGEASVLRQVSQVETLQSLQRRSQYLLSFLFVIAAGALFLLLFALNPAAREYLWLALLLLSVSILRILQVATVVDLGMQGWMRIASYAVLDALEVVAMVEFPFALFRRRVSPALRIVQVLGGSYVLLLLLLLPRSYKHFLTLWHATDLLNLYLWHPMLIIASLTLLVAVSACFRSRQGEMKWIGAALILITVTSVDRFLDFLGLPGLPQTLQAGAVTLDLRALAYVIFSAVMIVAMLIRFRRLQRRNQSVEQDIAAARSVQQVLIPDTLPQIPGLTIESAYLPAQEVGGDFFQIIPAPDGATLVVVGDVSGKGLSAAMTVALLVGAVRTLSESTGTPAQLLASLNRRLVGRGSGFATCLILSIAPDGNVVYANAGHLNPYLAGVEFPTEANLPLGLSLDVIYEDRPLHLTPGERLTLVTDGVVEATNPHTRELFGFARTESASAQPAEAIAFAAQQFGQPQADDITVLTLVRCA